MRLTERTKFVYLLHGDIHYCMLSEKENSWLPALHYLRQHLQA